MSQFSFTFPKDMKKEVERVAKERRCTIAQVIRDAIQKYIKDYEDRRTYPERRKETGE